MKKAIILFLSIILISFMAAGCSIPVFPPVSGSEGQNPDVNAGATGQPNQQPAQQSNHFLFPIHLSTDEKASKRLNQEFGNYYSVMKGFHPGEDWGIYENNKSVILGREVYSIGKGKLFSYSHMISKDDKGKVTSDLGWCVVIEHFGNFSIPGKTMEYNGQSGKYDTETNIGHIYSVYMHIDFDTKGSLKIGDDVDENTVLGTIMDPTGLSPHLHFEIRNAEPTGTKKANTTPSFSGTLVGDSGNWQVTDYRNGYYIRLQEMLDSGLRDPSDFLDANGDWYDGQVLGAATEDQEETAPSPNEKAVDEKIKENFKSQYQEAAVVNKIEQKNSEVYFDLTEITFVDGFQVVDFLKNELGMNDDEIASLPGFGGRYDPSFGIIGGYMATRYDIMQKSETLMLSKNSTISLVATDKDGQICNKDFTYLQFADILNGNSFGENLYFKDNHFSGGASIKLDGNRNIVNIREWYAE